MDYPQTLFGAWGRTNHVGCAFAVGDLNFVVFGVSSGVELGVKTGK